ncbi:MAG: hypothetical protein K2X93_16425 [Candidatus Obscuribacterales bacterium]|nr:hypothetical protein [Candidatus Obscuribacterales bacterium]
MALVMEQLYQLNTEVGAFFFFDGAQLKDRESDSGNWSMTDFHKEFEAGTLFAFQTATKGNFTLKFVQRPLSDAEKKALVAQHTFFYKVHHGRLYWDNGEHLPCAEGWDEADDDPEGWLTIANGEYKVTVYSQDWFTMPEGEREAAGDISHYVVQFEQFKGKSAPAVPQFLPWLPPSTSWYNYRRNESPQLISLFNQHICMSFDKQMRLAEWLEVSEKKAGGGKKGLLGGKKGSKANSWNYTISTATLELGSAKFTALSLGTFAFPDTTWFWTWHNPSSQKLTPENLQLRKSIESIGTKYGISAFSIPAYFKVDPFLGFAINEAAADIFAAITVGELGFDAYYKLPFEHGAGIAVIRDERLAFTEKKPVRRMLEIIPKTFMAITVPNHKEACISYARAYGLKCQEEGDTIKVNANGEELAATFDQLNRLIDLKASIGTPA